MCELGELHAILLAQQLLVVSTVAHLVDLDRFVALGRHEQLAGIVEIETQDVGLRSTLLDVFSLEEL